MWKGDNSVLVKLSDAIFYLYLSESVDSVSERSEFLIFVPFSPPVLSLANPHPLRVLSALFHVHVLTQSIPSFSPKEHGQF